MADREGRQRVYTPLPIRRITVGPMRHKEVSRITVGDLLLKNGYTRVPGDVDVSQVPFRFASSAIDLSMRTAHQRSPATPTRSRIDRSH
jgi:hypothetical protein